MPDDKNNQFQSGTGVEFHEEGGYRAIKYYRETSAPKIIRWAIKLSGGLIKNEQQASYILFAFVLLVIIISLFLFFSGGSKNIFKYKDISL